MSDLKRCNLEDCSDGIRLCRGNHHRSADCEWEYYVPLAAPIPTPSQQEAFEALEDVDDYARMGGIAAIGPIERLRAFILARPDEGNKP